MKLNETLDIINQNQNKIDSFGKFEEDIQKKINYKFRLDWNYYSNAMEGNSLTRVETKQLMMDNVTIDGKPFKDIAEMRGHDAEVLEIFKVGKGELRISEARIKRMHKTIMHEDDPTKKECIGIWKTSNNYLINYKGERIDFLPHEEVAEAVHSLLNKTNASIDSILRKEQTAPHPTTVAFEFHFEYLKIHPFYDGNGRTGRLLMNLILISFGFPPVILREKDRDSYYKLLAEIQGYGADPKDFYVFLGEMLIESQQLVMDALEGKEIEEVDDIDKEILLWKQQLNDEAIVIKRSENIIAQAYKKSLKPLLELFIVKNKQFEDLFAEKIIYIRLENYSKEGYDLKLIDDYMDYFESGISTWGVTDDFDTIKNFNHFSFEIYYKGFKNNGSHLFDEKTSVNVQFDEFHYRITNYFNGDVTYFKKLYSEQLSQAEILAFVNERIKELFEKIKTNMARIGKI